MLIGHESTSHGFAVVSDMLDAATIQAIVTTIHLHAQRFPFLHPTMRDGTPLSVKVTSFGDFGWWADDRGYRYAPAHPTTREPWPRIPAGLRMIARAFMQAAEPRGDHHAWAASVDTVLVNQYAAGASLGWHVDRTEADLLSPIVTMSIGAPAIFEIKLSGEVHRVKLRSGDGVVMAGASRNAEHRVVR